METRIGKSHVPVPLLAIALVLGPIASFGASFVYWTGQNGTVNRLDPATGLSIVLVQPFGNQGPTAITGVPNSKLYWNATYITGHGVINRSNFDGTGIEGVVASNSYTHIAVDPAGAKLYWRDNGLLKRANLDGTDVLTLTSSVQLESVCPNTLNGPGGLAFDPVESKVYFGWSSGSGICRTNADGTNPELVLNSAGALLPRGILVDPVGRHLYYVALNSPFGIKRANLDGSNVQHVYSPPFNAAIGFAAPTLDQPGGKLYWPELTYTGPTIKRANLDGTNVETVATLNTEAMGVVFLSDITVPPPACFPGLPAPQLSITGTEGYVDAFGTNVTRYKMSVGNFAAFPAELFAPAPNLPACGLNTNSSRTWVHIFGDDARIYGFCALAGPQSLTQIWFGVPVGQAPPSNVRITLEDRQCGLTYASNVVTVPAIPPDLALSNLILYLSNPASGLTSTTITPLSAKLRAALDAVERGAVIAARNQLNAFINQVQALERSGLMSARSAATLIAEANRIIASL